MDWQNEMFVQPFQTKKGRPQSENTSRLIGPHQRNRWEFCPVAFRVSCCFLPALRQSDIRQSDSRVSTRYVAEASRSSSEVTSGTPENKKNKRNPKVPRTSQTNQADTKHSRTSKEKKEKNLVLELSSDFFFPPLHQ